METLNKGKIEPFPILATVIALLIGIAVATFDASLIIGTIIMALILLYRRDGLAATAVILVSLYYDWYFAYRIIALILILVLLFIFFLNRSREHPWAEPRGLWLWVLFFVLAIYPAIKGALTVHDAIIYYPSIIFGAFIVFWLGTVIARDIASLRSFFKALSFFAMLVAIHTIIQATTGVTLLQSPQVNDYLASVSNYQLSAGSDISRLGSFFIQPNFCGTFFAMMVFLPLGLFVESDSFLEKMLYLAEMLIMLPALLFTYSASAWLAALVGIVVFVLLVGQARYRLQISLFIISGAIVMLVGFPSQVNLLLQHAFDPSELALRNAVWQTALRVIQAYPLTGIGLGHLAYLQRAEPYRVPAQFKPFDHPHNSYLELAAMAGIPVLCIFLALLLFILWQAFRNWARADARTRSLIGAGIVTAIALSLNSWSNQGWTLPPLAALGWLILGAISSPLLIKRKDNDMPIEKSNDMTRNA